jgi:8-oxo-dGTP diphosphatase
LLWLCDANALEVYAAMRGHERTPSDSYCAILARLNDGALASLAITRGAPAGSVQEEISIYGSQGSLFLRRFRVAAGGELATRDTSAGFIIQQTTGGEIVKEISGGEAKRWGPTEDFINCILRGGVPLSSGESNIRTVELIEAGYRAILGSLTDISLSNALVSDLGWSQARKTVVTPVGEQRYQLSGPVEDLHRREGNIEVHVAAICLRVNPETNALEVLLARRNPQKRIYPNLWEGGGGKVRPGENYHETVERELREELDVVVKVIAPLRTYEIDAPFLPQSKIPGTVFLCEVLDYVHGNTPKVDGTEMTEWRWQPVDQIDELDMIPNTYGDIQLASRLYSRIKEGTISFEL